MTTDTPHTDACPHCHSENYSCGTTKEKMANGDFRSARLYQSELCREREKSHKLEAEVERLTTDTQRTDACPHCGSIENDTEGNRTFYVCGTYHTKGCHPARSSLCCEIEERNELTQRAERAEAEVERLKQLLLVSDLPIEVVNNHIDTPRTDAASFSSRDPLELIMSDG